MKNVLYFFLFTSSLIGLGVLLGPDNPTRISGSISSNDTAVWVARVELIDESGQVIQSTLSDKNGQYRFDSLQAGNFHIRVTQSAYTSYQSLNFNLAEGEQFRLNIELNKQEAKAESPEKEVYELMETATEKPVDRGERAVLGAKTEFKSTAPTRSRGEEGMDFGMPEGAPVPESKIPNTPGTLTAGEINDFSKWELWDDLNQTTFDTYQKQWGLYLKNRYSVQVTYENGLPVVDAEVRLVSNRNEVVFLARTDNTGKAELWADMVPEVKDRMARHYKALVRVNGKDIPFTHLNASPNGFNTLKVPGTCNVSDIMDIAFVVDATGSMGDEINYLKTEMLDVIKRVKEANPELQLRTSSVFYRDHGDQYLTRHTDFNSDIRNTLDFISKQYAAGGGDFPEAVDEGLETALNRLSWSPEARGRLLFLILDAPPHQADSVNRRVQQLIYKAAAMGVRIIPVTGSGINKDVEFLMRSMALATNGTYVFLTDHSGVGNPHLEPSTDEYQVEKLNDLMVRLIGRYAQTTGCEISPSDSPSDSTTTLPDSLDHEEPLSLKCFPVPTNGPIDIEVNKAGGTIYIADANGKLVMRLSMTERSRIKAQLGQLAAGIYHIRYEWKDRRISKQIIVYH